MNDPLEFEQSRVSRAIESALRRQIVDRFVPIGGNQQVVENAVDAAYTLRNRTHVRRFVIGFQYSLQTHTVGDAPDDERRESEIGLREQRTSHILLNLVW
jgi:hypothetical protein